MARIGGTIRALLCMGVLAGLTFSQATPQGSRRVDDGALRNAPDSGEWLSHGLDPGEMRYSPLKQINASNANRLELAWSYDIGKGGGSQEANPLVSNGILYGITNWSIAFAVDARTGKERWRWDPQVDRDATRAKICCAVVNRGIALYDGKIFVPVIDGRLVALDADSGKVVWQAQVSSTKEDYTLTMAPRIAKGKVIIGVAGGEFPVRGYFDAYDAKTGKRVWRFYTVPGDPSKPFENEAMKRAAKTWGPDSWKMGGGGSVWDAISYDPETDLLYVGTGNPGPWPEEVRNTRGKDNLYACSIVAVKAETGEYKWHFQSIPGDSWDYDAVQQMTLADITINGRKRKVLMQAQKNGFFYVLDRVTGEFISAAPFARVNWATGLEPKTGRPIFNPEALYSKDPVSVSPGPGGGHNWAAMSFNPATGLVYIPATVSSSFNFEVVDDFVYKPGELNLGIVWGPRPAAPETPATPPPANLPGHQGANAADTDQTLPAPPPSTPPRQPTKGIGPTLKPGESMSVLLAWDPAKQKEVWRTPGGGAFGGGTLTTAGNLVFQVIPDGRLAVYSADKGEKLAEIQTRLGGGMGAPITYQLDGRQYISLMGGQGVQERYGIRANEPPQKPTASTVYPKVLTYVLDRNASQEAAK
jgi:PQQ-dependent dehydrogenase (methanol/ethanol family)